MRDQGPNRYRDAFVGRRRELAEICAGIDGALAARGCLFTISGEPGVGKSRLAHEAAAYAVAKGQRVLWGRCWEHGGAPAYWPWVQVLRRPRPGRRPGRLTAGWIRRRGDRADRPRTARADWRLARTAERFARPAGEGPVSPVRLR